MTSDVVTYQPRSEVNSRGERIMRAIWGLMAIALFAFAATRGDWLFFTRQLPLLLAVPLTYWLSSRRTYRADASGIHARFIMNEPWERIESVKTPSQWDEFAMVRMVGTGEERRTGFPPSYAEELAQVGGEPLV